MKKIFLSICLSALYFQLLFSQKTNIEKCSIVFDNSAIEAMYLHPQEILNNVDSFWNNNPAYKLTKLWHTINNVKIPYKQWTNKIKKNVNLTENQIKNNIAVINAGIIIEKQIDFNKNALPHIFSFLPKNSPEIKTNVYLLTGTVPYAFTTGDNIVIDVASPNFNKNPDRLLNILVHEVYHIGYAYTIAYRTEFEYENINYEYLTNYLLSEGLANYVSYTAQNIFPNHDFEDYKMLENMKTVEKQIKKVNSLFSKAGTISDADLKKLSWKIGVLQRGYYVAGAFMAQTIDEKLGRDSLVNALCTGPRKFINLYNSLVTEDLKLTEFLPPAKISEYQHLRLALINDDNQKFETIKLSLIQNKESLNSVFESKINSHAYDFIGFDNDNAQKLFELNTVLFPNSANVWDSLGEFEMEQGNINLAIKYYEKVLEIDSNNANAKNKLEELKTIN